MLVNVGSGGGAAAAPAAGGAAAGGAAAADEPAKEEEKKEEGTSDEGLSSNLTNIYPQKRKNQTRIWVSVFSTRLLIFRHFLFPVPIPYEKASSCTALARLQMETRGED